MKDNPPLRRSTLLIAASVGLTELAAHLRGDRHRGPGAHDLLCAVQLILPAGSASIRRWSTR
jgi:hypothetical protein